MSDDRVAALSQRQRECLRLVARGYEAKEIGRALGISDLTVKNHLSAARATLGVSRSIEAARLLTAIEATGASGTSAPAGIADLAYVDVERLGQSDPRGDAGGLRDGGIETSAWMPAESTPLLPMRRGRRNELGIATRFAIVVMLTVLLIAAVGFFVDASRGLRF